MECQNTVAYRENSEQLVYCTTGFMYVFLCKMLKSKSRMHNNI